jgi:hypothetical protein
MKTPFPNQRKELIGLCISSAGIIRIRFAGRDLVDLLSAQEYWAPRADITLQLM